MERWRKTESSISLIVPFMPSNNRSFGEAGSYTPSSSTMIVPSRPQNSSRVCQSRPLRAKRVQGVPVTPVAGQARRLHRHDGADAPLADRREQPLEARAPDAAGRSTEIIVDDLDVLPAKQSRSVGKAVLPTLALQIVSDLLGRRLPDVDNCAASQMFRRYLRHRTSPLGSRAPSPARYSSLRPTAPAVNPAPLVSRSP